MSDRNANSLPFQLTVLALLAVAAYLPTLRIPLLEDDYPNLFQSWNYGSPHGLSNLFHDPVFRLRATSYWAMFALWQASKLAPLAYHCTSLLLHIVNVWLLYGLCDAWPRMRGAAFWAAAFFAVQEGHQEAVMWFSAINELFLFVFGMAALLCWLRLRARGAGWGTYAGSLALFLLALLSKESAVILLPLFLLVAPLEEWWPASRKLLPFAVLATWAVATVMSTRAYSFRFSDGSFSLHAPFWITLPRSTFRLLWVWGLLSLVAILAAKNRELLRTAGVTLAWMVIALVPYCFLTYSTQIPSRQTYLASAGLAMLFGLAISHWSKVFESRPVIMAVVLAAAIASNTGYLWVKKRAQFIARAAPTEQLIALARTTPGPIWVRCFPRTSYIAEESVRLGAGYDPANLVWTEEDARKRHATAEFCYREGSGK